MANPANENYSELITIGIGKIQFGSVITDTNNLPTDYENMGTVENVQIDSLIENIYVERGFPTREIKCFRKTVGCKMRFELDEFDYLNLALAFNASISYDYGVGATTIASNSISREYFYLTSVSNFAVGDLIEVSYSDGSKQYRYIKYINGTKITLHKALTAIPIVGSNIKTVLTATVTVGLVDSTMSERSVWFTHHHDGINGDIDLLIYRGSLSIAAPVDFSLDKMTKIPIEINAIADSTVNNGNVLQWGQYSNYSDAVSNFVDDISIAEDFYSIEDDWVTDIHDGADYYEVEFIDMQA